MRQALFIALSCLLLPHTAAATDLKEKAFVVFVQQTRTVQMDCFPDDLRTILGDLRKKFDRPVVVTSGHRTGRHARRGSQHRFCKAADIRIQGVPAGAIASFARAHPLVGGVGTYCGSRTGMVHVDIGPKRSWRHCRRRR